MLSITTENQIKREWERKAEHLDFQPDPERRVRMGIDADTTVRIVEITGNAEYFKAIGYLSTWNLSHAHCEIIGGVYDGNPEIIATYRRHADGPITYQIGAVWHGTHFGFHS